MTIDVRPEEIHTCAGAIVAEGHTWGDAYAPLERTTARIADLYGGDAIGRAIHRVFDPFLPQAASYTEEVGFAALETGAVLDRVAVAYMDVESDNEVLAGKVQAEVDRLGR